MSPLGYPHQRQARPGDQIAVNRRPTVIVMHNLAELAQPLAIVDRPEQLAARVIQPQHDDSIFSSSALARRVDARPR